MPSPKNPDKYESAVIISTGGHQFLKSVAAIIVLFLSEITLYAVLLPVLFLQAAFSDGVFLRCFLFEVV